MLKRSFMELHAQRALKDHAHLLDQGETVLQRINALADSMRNRPCGCPCGCVFGTNRALFIPTSTTGPVSKMRNWGEGSTFLVNEFLGGTEGVRDRFAVGGRRD